MSYLEEIKKRKPFALLDILFYGVLVAAIIVLFCIFVFGGKGKEASGIEVQVDGKVVYTYRYGIGGETVKGYEYSIIEEIDNDTVYVTVMLDESGKEKNVIVIDTLEKRVVMHDATCSFRKDCTHMKAISTERDVIICLPHKLKVLPIGFEEDLFHPSVG